jgi:large subunit ribosomal protein L25
LKLFDLNAEPRTTTGNGPARVLRRSGKMPAVLYGQGVAPESLTVSVKDLETVLKGSSGGQMFLSLSVEGAPKKTVLLKELQRHPVSGDFLHADFYQVDMNRRIKVMVPVTTRGKCIGVEMGGMLQVIRRSLEVECLPDRIPDHIEIDITDLQMGESVHVEDIDLGEEVELPHEVNFTVLTILSGRKKTEEEEEEEGVEEEEAAAEGEAAPAE